MLIEKIIFSLSYFLVIIGSCGMIAFARQISFFNHNMGTKRLSSKISWFEWLSGLVLVMDFNNCWYCRSNFWQRGVNLD